MTTIITTSDLASISMNYRELERAFCQAMQNGYDVVVGEYFCTRTSYGWSIYRNGGKVAEGLTTGKVVEGFWRKRERALADVKAALYYASQLTRPVTPPAPPTRPLPQYRQRLLCDDYSDGLQALRALGAATKFLR